MILQVTDSSFLFPFNEHNSRAEKEEGRKEGRGVLGKGEFRIGIGRFSRSINTNTYTCPVPPSCQTVYIYINQNSVVFPKSHYRYRCLIEYMYIYIYIYTSSSFIDNQSTPLRKVIICLPLTEYVQSNPTTHHCEKKYKAVKTKKEEC